MKTIGDALDRQNGFGGGFDFARLLLAFMVLAWHSLILCRGDKSVYDAPFLWLLNYPVMPMFFGLSGFLVAASARRLTLGNFYINRGLRVLPALSVEVVLSALMLGPLVTSFSLAAYFRDEKFAAYFLNIVGDVQFLLPGVFLDVPAPDAVNGSLWTVRGEILCYGLLGVMITFGLQKRIWTLFLLTALLVEIRPILTMWPDADAWVHSINYISFLPSPRGSGLLPSFLLGVIAYEWRNRLTYDWRAFVAAGGLMLAAGFWGAASWWVQPVLQPIFCGLSVYLIIGLGVSKLEWLQVGKRGDYSYGIYLYAFPVQQALLHYFPGLAKQWGLHAAIAAMLVTGFAMLSWHFVEKPVLRLRKNFSFVARRREIEPGA